MSFRRALSRFALLGAASATALACIHVTVGRVVLERGTFPASWYAGGKQCEGRPGFQVHQFNESFFILRQVACTNYEKPFLYLVIGQERALLLDTGAGGVDVIGPVDTLLRVWSARHERAALGLIVAHSHSHGDHVAGDSQFVGRPNTVVVGRDTSAVRRFWGIKRWPQDRSQIDLGNRVLDVLPIPGHQPASIALYDRQTGVMLTGDTFYPGRLYVRDTAAYANSIQKLAAFAEDQPVTFFLGAHVEQSRTPAVDYPVGTIDQPNEHELQLFTPQLVELDSLVRAQRGRFVRTLRRDFTLWPVSP